jgi:nucleoside-diphosphate-sugar epimerase
MRTPNPQTLFMTGATGFLGHYILRDLLRDGHRIVALVRAPRERGEGRLAGMLERAGLQVEEPLRDGRLRLIEGSLPARLPASVEERLDGVVSCAASLQLFADGNAEPFETNVSGTQALLQWAERHRIGRVYAVSTAYVCGWTKGVIPETLHTVQPDFQTDYEHSKWKSERLYADWSAAPGRTLTLFRPAFLVGDSVTGRTTQFGGFYQFARLMSVLKERYADPDNGELTRVPLRIPGRPEHLHNFVPVDFCSRIVSEVIGRPEFHGRIYHLTNPDPPSNEMLKRCYEEYFGLCGGHYADPDEVVGHCTPAEALLWDRYELVAPRLTHSPQFDTTNTQAVMKAAGVDFPHLDRERMFRLFDYAARHNWGRNNGRSRR